MNYQESIDYLYSLARLGIKLGLENTSQLLDYFDNPQLKTPTIHIAGTNGKGSVASFSESILRASGHQVGLYTSPHLLDFRERIQINRRPIEPEELIHWVSVIKQASMKLKISPTFFEFTTVMAFLHFEGHKTDWNVVEVGMGGRLDSTNLCHGRVCIITSISRDHESSLGTQLEQIAREKAAIIKHPCTVVCGSEEPEVMRVIEDQCRTHEASLIQSGKDFKVYIQSQSPDGQVFDFNGPEIWYKGLEISLTGRHQSGNAGLAVSACTTLGDPSITEQSIREGLKSARWPGRMEICGRNPYLIMDCAHNLDSFMKLTTALSDLFPNKRKVWVLGIMKDKPLTEIATIIPNHADYIIVTQPKNERSAAPEQIRDALAGFNQPVDIVADIPLALDRAYQVASPEDLILVTGSLFTVAEAKQVIENQTQNL
ncbi:MAG: bifunctional folylpolyglutamate synthase/dihydrofolate synthase [Nitrospinota bacterium]|nr:bifunctional folylpolyglutamate synthase/dihydrofolate synthase [Nitrospinota bacterium]